MTPWYFLAFLFLVFSVSLRECNELEASRPDERVVELPQFAANFVNYVSSLRSPKNTYTEGNADAYVDRLFTGLREYLSKNYEPLQMKNLAPEVKSIYFEGLSTVVRIGSVTITSDGVYSFVTAHMGFHKFKGQAIFEKKLWWLVWISGIANVDVRGIEFYFKLRGHFGDDTLKFDLKTLTIRDWGKLETTLQGTNWIGSLAGFVTKMFPNICSNWIKNNVPSLLYSGINDALRDITFSLNDIDLPFYNNKMN